ncbi:MAG: YitT family protein [Clostridiales bacterium]|nr:YitT family protein [Clostridiales bacterium]
MEEKQGITTMEEQLPKKITKQDTAIEENNRRRKIELYVRAVLFTALSSLLIAFAAYSLITPHDFTIGGASGIAILVNVATNGTVPQSVLVFGLNFPLVVLAFFFVRRKFAILSALNIGLQTLWLFLIELVLPDFEIVFSTEHLELSKLFAALASGVCIGVAIALAFKAGGSTGGADILAVIIQKKFRATSIAWMIFIINCVVIGSSVFVFKVYDNGKLHLGMTLLPIVLSVFESYIESKTNESMTNGFQSAIEFRIITEKPEEMSLALMKELSRGVTAIPATGMYTKISKTMLVCVISRRQVATLRRIMKTVDPDSFAVMSKVSQVLGFGFYTADEH